MHCVSIASPAFDAQYASDSGQARTPDTDEIVTIEPRRAARWSIAARHVRKAPVRFVRRTSSQVAGSRSRSEPSPPIPALQTSASSADVGDDGVAADLGRHVLDRAGPPPRHGHRVAVGREPPRDRGPDPGSSSGDESDLVTLCHLPSSRTVSRSSTV
jgi:hypothetical protein